MKKVFGIVLVVIGILVTLFFDHYKGTIIPWPIAWFMIGIAISGLGSYLISNSPSKKVNKAAIKNKARIEQLKLSGKRISIDVENLEVLTGYRKIVDDGESIPASLSGDLIVVMVSDYIDDEPAVDQDVETSVLVYKTEFAGKKMKFVSSNIRKDGATLEFLLGNKKLIDLYVDRNDVANFWFDLEFLKD